MTLKQAIEKARVFGFKWIAVDSDLSAYGYSRKPLMAEIEFFTQNDAYLHIGTITEPINWQESLTEIK